MEPLKKALYLDDERIPTTTIQGFEPWYTVRNYDEFVQWITDNGIPDLVSFDHDLGDEHYKDYTNFQAQGIAAINYGDFKEKTGFDCALWLCEFCELSGQKLDLVSVHSFNPLGAKNIQTMVNNFKKHMGWPQDCFMMKHPFVMKSDEGEETE